MNRILSDNREIEPFFVLFLAFCEYWRQVNSTLRKFHVWEMPGNGLKNLIKSEGNFSDVTVKKIQFFKEGCHLHIYCHGIEELEKLSENLFLKLLSEVKAFAHWSG